MTPCDQTTDVTILFARADSVYKTIAGCDVFDAQRDAKTWVGGTPLVAHPPCRAWGRLKRFAKPLPGEKELAFLAAAHVRRYGGVLEHPKDSSLWKAVPLPKPGQHDEYGGWTLQVDQFRWGHRAGKMTWFYIVGVKPSELPPIPIKVGEPTHHIGGQSGRGLLYLPRPEREHTPPQLAAWLVEVARRSTSSCRTG